MKQTKLQKIKKENRELKETIKLLSNSEVIKKLNSAIEDLKHGRFIVE